MKKKNVFLRAYLHDNLGDDLFLQIITHRYPEVTFHLKMTEEHRKTFAGNVALDYTPWASKWQKLCYKLNPSLGRAVSGKQMLAMAQKADLCVYIIGSGYIQPKEMSKKERAAEVAFYDLAPYVIGCNFGPYREEVYREFYAERFAKASDICFRDAASRDLFPELPRVRHAMDVVFCYDLGEDAYLPADTPPYTLFAVVGPEKYAGAPASFAAEYTAYLKECIASERAAGRQVYLLSFCRSEGDEKYLAGLVTEGVTLLRYPEVTYRQVAGLFAGATKVVAGRYHAMILGLLYRRPTCVLAYSEKTTHVLQDILPEAKALTRLGMLSVKPREFLEHYAVTMSEERLAAVKASAQRQFEKLDAALRG